MLSVSQGQTPAAGTPVSTIPAKENRVKTLANELKINPMAMMPGGKPQTQPKPSPTQTEQPAPAKNLTRDRPTMANRRRPTNGAQGTIAAMSPESKTEVVALSNLPSPPPSPKVARQVQLMVQPNAMGHEEIVDAGSETPALSNSTIINNDGFVLVDNVQDDFSQAIEEEKAALEKEIESTQSETQEIPSGLQSVVIEIIIDETGFTLIDSLSMPTLEPVTETDTVELDQIPILSAVDASLPNVNPATDNQSGPAAPKGFWEKVGDFITAIGRFFLMCITCGAYGRGDRQ